jgi:hypothetical protein
MRSLSLTLSDSLSTFVERESGGLEVVLIAGMLVCSRLSACDGFRALVTAPAINGPPVSRG